ncbi:SpoIIE family protein phosphatase [Streptomyces sp. NPDC127097]|uniref:SpoIIE family protein phosphatase n=1 Tax=Streptomyces sp. NPDC127097 TaxID=3347136 RepID=UPI0036574D68
MANGSRLPSTTPRPAPSRRDRLLLYTEGVIEARDRDGVFYLSAERAVPCVESSPETLLHHIRRDLPTHVGGRLDRGDAAHVAIHRPPPPTEEAVRAAVPVPNRYAGLMGRAMPYVA